MIDQTRISELRRIYDGSNNETYRTVNQLLDEIERLNEEKRNQARPISSIREMAEEIEAAAIVGEQSILGQPVEEVSIKQPTEDIQLTELTE